MGTQRAAADHRVTALPQAGPGSNLVAQSASTDHPPASAATGTPLLTPSDQVVNGVVFRPVWDATNAVWDFADSNGQGLDSSMVGGVGGSPAASTVNACRRSPDLVEAAAAFQEQVRFWAAFQAVGETLRARKITDEAVARLVAEQGPTLEQMDQEIAYARNNGFNGAQEQDWIRGMEAKRKVIIDAYDPSIPRSSKRAVPSGLFVLLPYSSTVTPLAGPPSPAQVEQLAYQRNAALAPAIKPDQMAQQSKFGGRVWNQQVVRTSVGDAYAYDIETNMFQVADDLDRLSRAGYTEIHVATGTHGDAVGGLDPEFSFLRQDARSIYATMQRNPGLKIIPYRMSDPIQAARFDALQALAAEGKLSGGATIACFCFSESRVLDPNPTPAGPYQTREFLNPSGPTPAAYAPAGLAVGAGALSIYSGMHDPNRVVAGLKIVGGGA
ncbi:MAG: hypothetical protein ABI873_16005, partial [Marmoricola sp.]